MFPEVGHHLKCYLIFSEDNFFGSYGTCLDTKRKKLDREDTQYKFTVHSFRTLKFGLSLISSLLISAQHLGRSPAKFD